MASKASHNWDEVGKLFTFAIPKQLEGEIDDAIETAKDIYTGSILRILEEQPSDWTEKGESWTKRSGNKELYFGQQGQFFMNVVGDGNSRKLRAKQGDKKVFVGARHDVSHHSGFSMEQIALILANTPSGGSRELFGRAYERVEDEIIMVFRQIGISLK